MHLIWSSEVKCVVTVWFLWSFWYILSNGVGDVTSRWCHFWFTSQHQSDLKYITHNSGSHYCFYYRSHQHTRTRNKNIYIALKDYPQIRVWSYLPQVVHSFWERPSCLCNCREQDVVTSVGPSLHSLSVKDVIKVQDRGEKRVPGQGVGGSWFLHKICRYTCTDYCLRVS